MSLRDITVRLPGATAYGTASWVEAAVARALKEQGLHDLEPHVSVIGRTDEGEFFILRKGETIEDRGQFVLPYGQQVPYLCPVHSTELLDDGTCDVCFSVAS